MEKKTPLYPLHIELGGKIVPFAGYLLPVQFPTGLIAEHKAVRNACGLFDVSHMGEILFEGPDAFNALQHVLTNDLSGMQIGRVRYSPVCNERGGVVDDLIVYKFSEEKYFLVVNAANKGVPFVLSHPQTPVSKAVQGVARMIVDDSGYQNDLRLGKEKGKKNKKTGFKNIFSR